MNLGYLDTLPRGVDEWRSWAALMCGASVGWLASPSLWLVWPPLRWLSAVSATAAAESGFSAVALGDAGRSVGMVQIYDTTAAAMGWPSSRLTSAWWSGWYSARYTRGALLTSWRWWAMASPIYGWAMLRYLWRRGPGSIDTTSAADVWAEYTAEPLAALGFPLWRLLSLIALATGAYFLVMRRKK